MSRIKKSTRKSRKGKVTSNTNKSDRALARARTVIKKSSETMGLMGGTPFDKTHTIGMDDNFDNSITGEYKTMVSNHIRDILRAEPRDWTLIIAVFNDVHGEVRIECEGKVFHNTTPAEFDRDSTDFNHEMQQTMWGENSFCNIWIAIPHGDVGDYTMVVSEFDEFLEYHNATDKEMMDTAMANRLQANHLNASKYIGTPFHILAIMSAEELSSNGLPASIHLSMNSIIVSNVESPARHPWVVVACHKGITIRSCRPDGVELSPEDMSTITDLLRANIEIYIDEHGYQYE